MQESRANGHFQGIQELYEKYRSILGGSPDVSALLEHCSLLYDEMDRLNQLYGFWNRLKGWDTKAVYYIAEFALSLRGNAIDSLRREDFTVLKFASRLHQYLCDRSKLRIHVIEPHPDDALGSAGGICYSDHVITTLHTICRSNDRRDHVCLTKQGRGRYPSLKRDMNISVHLKYDMPDLHYDLRIQDEDITLEQKIAAYRDWYDSLELLTGHIQDIFDRASREGAYVSFPMAPEHPLHILVTSLCLKCVQDLDFNRDKIIIYSDHPYDFQLIGTRRISETRSYIESFFPTKLLLCNDLSVDQHQIGAVVEEIYGSLHYGEFDGSFEKTLCSCYLTESAYSCLKSIFPLHYNNVLYVSAQAWPFYKTGGLGEVAYGYCRALQSSVNDVRLMIPGYVSAQENGPPGRSLCAFTFDYESINGAYFCEIEKREFQGLMYYLFKIWDPDGRRLDFSRKQQGGKDFVIFCDAILQKGLNAIDYFPTVCHCNDWQTALIPFLKRTKYLSYHPDMRTVYTIHFYGYKGIFPKREILTLLGMDKEQCGLCITCGENCILDKIDLLNRTARWELVQMPPSLMSCMRAGIEFADAVTTVSRGYAEELRGYSDFTDVKVTGIRNGIVTPQEKQGEKPGPKPPKDEPLREYKARQKRALQTELGLSPDADTPVICMVTRLAVEKGIELVRNILPYLFREKMQMIIVGDDSHREVQSYADFFRRTEQENTGKFAYRAYDEGLEYRTYAGSDILLMPSLSEACGTTQMIAMRFGVIPIVPILPGFRDTVMDYKQRKLRTMKDWDKGIGFYAYRDDCWVFLEVIKKALEIYRSEPEEWDCISEICSEADFSWKNGSLYEYLKLYGSLGRASVNTGEFESCQ